METQKNNLSHFDLALQRRSEEQLTSILKSSIAKEDNGKKMSQKIVSLQTERNTLRNFLILFVQHFECTFSRDTFMNVKYAEEYIEAATYLKDTYKREGDIISHVEIWIEEQNQKF